MVAGSVDSAEKTLALSDKLGITYPMAYGLDPEEVSRLIGSFYEKEKNYLHASGFIVRPNNSVEMAVYSTGAIGRFVAKDALSAVKYYKSLLTK